MTGSFKPRQSLNHYKPAWSSQIVLNTVVWGSAWPFEPNLPTSTLPTELNGRRQRILIIINLQLECYWEQPHVMALKSITHTSAPLYVQPCLRWRSSGWCQWSELLNSHITLSFMVEQHWWTHIHFPWRIDARTKRQWKDLRTCGL